MSRVRSAVNQDFVGDELLLKDGDEVALLPPVAGGSGPRKIAIDDEPLDLDGDARGGLRARPRWRGDVHRGGAPARSPPVGRRPPGVRGVRRDGREGARRDREEIEHEWPGTAVAIHHRVGALDVGDVAVAITAAAAHRAPAFDACRAAIDRLKHRAPIWKKEIGENGEAWLGLGP